MTVTPLDVGIIPVPVEDVLTIAAAAVVPAARYASAHAMHEAGSGSPGSGSKKWVAAR
ncbi:MAG: hypothetical protein ABI867_24125 [Kofleriaceae bacterium]